MMCGSIEVNVKTSRAVYEIHLRKASPHGRRCNR